MEVVVTEDTNQETDTTIKYEFEADTEDNQSTAAEDASDKKVLKDSEDDDKNTDQSETMQGGKMDDKQTGINLKMVETYRYCMLVFINA